MSLGQIDQGTYDALFTEGGPRDSVDLRYQWVQAVLAQPAPVAAMFTDRPPHVRPLFAGMAAAADRGDHATRVLHVTLGRVRIRHGSSGRRWLHVDLDTLEPVSVTLSITRQGPTLVRQAEASVLGRHRFKVAIPNGAKAGPARLRLRVRDASGRVASITRVVQIPPA